MVKTATLPIVFLILVLSACASTGTLESASETPEKIPVTGSPPNAAVCTDSAAFVSDVTISDGTSINPGETFSKIWRVQNTGTCSWAERYRLVFIGGEQMGASDSVPLKVTQPGQTLDIAIDMTAPETEGEYRADFEIHNPAGDAISLDNGTVLWVIITVETATDNTGEN